MKKISLLFTLFIAFLAFTSCSSKSELVIEVPELSQGEITIIYATPDQIDSRQQETLKTVQITNGKAQIVFDTISFDKKIPRRISQGKRKMPRAGIEPATRGFSVLCSTN